MSQAAHDVQFHVGFKTPVLGTTGSFDSGWGVPGHVTYAIANLLAYSSTWQ